MEIFASDTTWVAEKTGQPKYQVIDHSKIPLFKYENCH